MGTVMHQPVVVQPGSGRRLPNLGVTHLITSAETGGAYYLCEAIFKPESGSPLHIHHREDELIYVHEGALDVRLDGETLHIPAGGVIQLPRKLSHALYNPLQTPLKIMVQTMPGGLEGYFDEVEAALAAGTLDADLHATISARYELEWLE